MEVHQLQILRELGSLGSVTAVAQALNVSSSAVSQHLAALQRGFRVPLTQKQGRTLVLTNAGRVLAEAGGDVIDAIASARSAVESYESASSGTVTVSGFVSIGQVMFGALIEELQEEEGSPEVRFTDEDVAQHEFPRLASLYDVVLAHRLEHSSPWPASGLRTITLIREPLDIALPRDHALASASSIRPEDVAHERWVTSRGGFSPHDVTGAIAAVANHPANVVHRINDYIGVAEVVASGDAIGILPRYTSGRAQDERIVLRPLAGIQARRSIDVLIRPENLHRRSVQAVISALQRVVTRIVDGRPSTAVAG